MGTTLRVICQAEEIGAFEIISSFASYLIFFKLFLFADYRHTYEVLLAD